MVVDVDHGYERSDGTSKCNDAEVRVVVDVVYRLLRENMHASEIGIVTPYGSQVREIRRALGHGLRDVETHSVDGFQGREKTVIIFSAVRANRGGHVGFLADWCRTNVAVTRAKNGLIVIGREVSLLFKVKPLVPLVFVPLPIYISPCPCLLFFFVCFFVLSLSPSFSLSRVV